jgi:16S rRNA (cytosine1402-N4)-methyltransferase
MDYKHTPVMLAEVMSYLQPQTGGNFIDCTLGGGGYTKALLDRVGKKGKIISIDADELAINNAKKNLVNYHNLILVNNNFKNLKAIIDEILENRKSEIFNGVVFDLGLSSAQLEDRSRGLSFRVDAPLNMSFGGKADGKNTTEIVNKHSEQELARIIWQYGEERYANKIAQRIVNTRKLKTIKTTSELVDVISRSVPASYRNNQKIHFATRTFQALRIATNSEIENLTKALPQAKNLLLPGGRIVIVSYHSLEDRVVKNFFRQESRNCVCPPLAPICNCHHKPNLKIITKKPILPKDKEITANPRARSAKMRVAEKI